MNTARRNLSRTYSTQSIIIKLEPVDTQQGRRDAYQKWCPQQLTWALPTNTQTSQVELKPDNSKKNDFGYWNQYTKK